MLFLVFLQRNAHFSYFQGLKCGDAFPRFPSTKCSRFVFSGVEARRCFFLSTKCLLLLFSGVEVWGCFCFFIIIIIQIIIIGIIVISISIITIIITDTGAGTDTSTGLRPGIGIDVSVSTPARGFTRYDGSMNGGITGVGWWIEASLLASGSCGGRL